MSTPIRHLDCGWETVPRWVLDDAGEPVVVAWCGHCGYPPANRELSRVIEVTDVPPALLAKAMRPPGRVQ